MAAFNPASFAMDGGDPRIEKDVGRPDTYIAPQARLLHDPAVTFEEYHYYALKTRAEEDAIDANFPGPKTGIMDLLWPPKSTQHDNDISDGASSPPVEKRRASSNINLAEKSNRAQITDEEWTNASRAFRTATWAACFYLITTDILGPFGVGYVLTKTSSSAPLLTVPALLSELWAGGQVSLSSQSLALWLATPDTCSGRSSSASTPTSSL